MIQITEHLCHAIEVDSKLKQGAITPQERDIRLGAMREFGMQMTRVGRGARMTDREVKSFQEVMTTAHFASYFADAISRAFYSPYARQTGSWRSYTLPDTVPDFRPVKRFRMSRPGTLLERGENGQMIDTAIEESEVSYSVKEYARKFAISWQTLENDDLGAIRQTSNQMGLAATQFEDEFVNLLYDAPTPRAALVALGTNYAGTGVLNEANLVIALNAFTQRTDNEGVKLGLRGVWLVIPPILEIQARKILESIQVAGGDLNDKNIVGTMGIKMAIDPHINTDVGVPWYLFAEPAAVPGVTVARLAGVSGPFTFSKSTDISIIQGSAPGAFRLGDFHTGDIMWAVETIIGGNDDVVNGGITDVNGLYFSDGTV